MATLSQAVEQWNTELSIAGGLMAASRYQLEQCSEVFWQEIMRNDSVHPDVVQAHRLIQAELRRRTI